MIMWDNRLGFRSFAMRAGLAQTRRIAGGCRRGTAATEFVVTLPLLIVFCLATVDFGRFAYLAISLDNAARVGAERGATRSFTNYTRQSWEDNVKSRVNEELSDVNSGWLINQEIDVTTSSTSNNLARITVAAQGDFVTIIHWPFLSGNVAIHREISMRQFR
jgi:Flp pilus assembly protein TadG